MNLGKLGKQVLIGGALVLFLSAMALGAHAVLMRRYMSENENVFNSIGRELSGDNARWRERGRNLQIVGKFTFAAGVIVMIVGGVFMYADARSRQGA